MNRPGQKEQIGIYWIAAIAVLLVLLIVGMISYFRMGIRLVEPRGRASLLPAAIRCAHNPGEPNAEYGQDRDHRHREGHHQVRSV